MVKELPPSSGAAFPEAVTDAGGRSSLEASASWLSSTAGSIQNRNSTGTGVSDCHSPSRVSLTATRPEPSVKHP